MVTRSGGPLWSTPPSWWSPLRAPEGSPSRPWTPNRAPRRARPRTCRTWAATRPTSARCAGSRPSAPSPAEPLLAVLVPRTSTTRLLAISLATFGALSLCIWNAPLLSSDLAVYIALFIAIGAPGLASPAERPQRHASHTPIPRHASRTPISCETRTGLPAATPQHAGPSPTAGRLLGRAQGRLHTSLRPGGGPPRTCTGSNQG